MFWFHFGLVFFFLVLHSLVTIIFMISPFTYRLPSLLILLELISPHTEGFYPFPQMRGTGASFPKVTLLKYWGSTFNIAHPEGWLSDLIMCLLLSTAFQLKMWFP